MEYIELGPVIPETEKPISHIVLPDSVNYQIFRMHARLAFADTHDLLVLFGPIGQRGSVRLITGSEILENSTSGVAFADAPNAAVQARDRYRHDRDPNTAILGIGTAAGLRRDITLFIALGYDIYYAGGLTAVEEGKGSPILHHNGSFFVKGENEEPTTIPRSNILRLSNSLT